MDKRRAVATIALELALGAINASRAGSGELGLGEGANHGGQRVLVNGVAQKRLTLMICEACGCRVAHEIPHGYLTKAGWGFCRPQRL